jgi:CubicO group peptidase (beta-lactamase class C family)
MQRSTQEIVETPSNGANADGNASGVPRRGLSHLRTLEAESIYILREAAAEFSNPVMLYSIGKDSSVMLRLAQKAFFPGRIPFPLLHVDTSYKTDFLPLRMVIERISGKQLETFMADRIFIPLGMKTQDIIPNNATLYSRHIPDPSRFEFVNRDGDGVLSDHQMWIVPRLYPESVRAGVGLVMNALDLAKSDAALSAKTLLHVRTIEEMWAPVKLLDGRTGDYAAGWRRWVQDGKVIVGHAGGGVEYDRLIDGHYSVILLTDCPGTNTHSFALGVLRLHVAGL